MDTTATGRPAHQGWIAVVGQWRKGHLRVPLPYATAIESAHGRPKVLSTFALSPTDEAPDDLDIVTGLDPYDPSPLHGACGLVIPGGGDVDPELYGRPRHPRTHNVSQRRDRFELTLVAAALERDMPVFAICHGMQLLNVHLGGTLDQHLLDDPAKLDHYRDRPLGEPAHSVAFKEGSLLEGVFSSVRADVNTHHHQGLDTIAPELEEIGWAEDGVLEAVVSREHSWVVGVQWHPEAMAPVDDQEQRLFDAFVAATKRYQGAEAELTARSA